jgi:hypothetical protein
MRLIHASDPAAIDHKALRYLEQAYAIVKPGHTHGAEFDFGQFNSSAGAEVIESNANWNYSRSLLFAWAIPAYEFGFRSNVPITKEFSAGFQLVNAWNTVWGNNDLKNIGITTALTKPRYTWSVNYYEGPNHMGATAGKRNLVDTTVLLTPSDKFNAYVNFDYGHDNRIGTSTSHDNWTGIAGAARLQLRSKIGRGGAPRVVRRPDRLRHRRRTEPEGGHHHRGAQAEQVPPHAFGIPPRLVRQAVLRTWLRRRREDIYGYAHPRRSRVGRPL